MTFDDNIRDKELQYDIDREAAKISPLSSRRSDKYRYLTGEQILPSDRRRMIEQIKFTFSLSGIPKLWKNKQKQLKNKEKTSRSFKSFKTCCSSINNY